MATKILVLYYRRHGQPETLGRTLADGASDVEGVKVDLKRVPEARAEEVPGKAGTPVGGAPPAAIEDLIHYDAIIFGTPVAGLCRQMRKFLDQTGEPWMDGGMIGKVGSVFACAGKGRAQATSVASFHAALRHQGMVIVGLPAPCRELLDGGEGGDESDGGHWQPSEKELAMARFQGRHVAQVTRWLVQGCA